MKLLVSGEGPSDIGACNNAQGVCRDGAFSPGPMTVWLIRLWETLLDYNLLDTPEAVVYVSKKALDQKTKGSGKPMQNQRGKKQAVETGLYFSNAKHLGLIARQLAADHADSVMAVLFHDTDGTRSAPGQLWQTKWDSMVNGFASAAFDFGVPMLPKPKSEAWLLCATQKGCHSHATLENISGNDKSPKFRLPDPHQAQVAKMMESRMASCGSGILPLLTCQAPRWRFHKVPLGIPRGSGNLKLAKEQLDKAFCGHQSAQQLAD